MRKGRAGTGSIEERALKEGVASLKGRVEMLVEKERAYMRIEEIVEGRFKLFEQERNRQWAVSTWSKLI